MSENVFTPKINLMHEQDLEQKDFIVQKNNDVGTALLKVAQYAVIALFGLLPIFFTPGLWASLGFDKSILTVGVSALVVIMVSLLTLRCTKSATVLPISLSLFWAVVLTAVVSGLLSGDTQEAMRGSVLETQTVAFLGVLALAMTIPLVLQGSKIMSVRALAFFSVAAVLLLAYNLIRLLLGVESLPIGSFTNVTVSPIGGFNDLAIFAGLMIILALITLVQLPLKTWLQSILFVIILMSLSILSIVNFFNIWIVVGFFGLLVFLYLLSRDTLFRSSNDLQPLKSSRLLVVATVVVCIVSAVFIVVGDYAGGKINELTEINHFEVQPTLGATIDVAQSVYGENMFLGIGPNRFADAWRQYKDRSISETIFWDTDFSAGSGYLPTIFINIGLIGGLLMVLFHLYFLYLGYKMLLRSKDQDPYWYYLGVTSFTAACFVWGMSYVYVPGAGILLIGAVFTGLTFVAAGALLPSMVCTIPLAVNRQRGFFLMAAIILVVTASVGILFSVSKQYVAQSEFNKAQATAASAASFEDAALSSFELYPDDRFVSSRAQAQLGKLSSLLAIQSPDQEQQQSFLKAAEQAIRFAEQALSEDITNPDNHAVLASVYGNLAIAGVDGAQERAESSLMKAASLDPLNPGYHLISAQLAARIGDLPSARKEITAALNLKNNYTEALYLSAQLDIGEGNVESAITTTRAIVTLEPNNPTRYFQLGVLLAANNDNLEAIEAYKVAISLNYYYANARYLLALIYLDTDQTENALEQLRAVLQTNTENQELSSLISQVENGEYVSSPNKSLTVPVEEASPSEGFADTVTTNSDVDTDLVTPVNVISKTESEEDPVPDNEPATILDESVVEEDTPTTE
ncbi:MAG: Flp pilus assembly protein TadD [Candidatus Paceibacteria bacterium]|jgi:Flp pilus assembly protein TadD